MKIYVVVRDIDSYDGDSLEYITTVPTDASNYFLNHPDYPGSGEWQIKVLEEGVVSEQIII